MGDSDDCSGPRCGEEDDFEDIAVCAAVVETIRILQDSVGKTAGLVETYLGVV